MAIENSARGLADQIEEEIRQYTTENVQVGEAYDYSQYKLVRRITLFESHTYPTGKFDSQGNYKFWYDGISSRISNEVKNIDFDTKDIVIDSDRQNDTHNDDLPVLIANLCLKEYLRETGQDDELNEAVEEGSGWGNVVWKKVKKSYERVDLKNFYVINQTARSLDQTPVIERHPMSSSDLRAKSGTWENVKETLDQCKSDTYKTQIQSAAKNTTVPYYEIFERNGEVCLKDLKETLGQEPAAGDDEKYVFAKVIAAATVSSGAGISIKFINFAQELKGKDNCDLYQEFHRGPYKGKWMREGLYELLFDGQVRLNQIGNQIAQGLELASKILLTTPDKLIVQNILSDLKNGDIIRAAGGVVAINLAMPGFAQLVEDWNTVQQLMNDVANSSPIVTGEGLPQRMPFQIAALLNQNSNKLFDYIRQKLSIPLTVIFDDWIVPAFIKDLSAKEILRLTGDSSMLDRVYDMIVENWYTQNLVALGPHGQDVADFLKAQQLAALKKRPKLVMSGIQEVFKDFQPSTSVVIAGENSTLPQDMATLSTFIQLEQDPIRRSAMIELAMAKKGIDVAALPKSPPMQPNQPQPSPIQPGQDGKMPAIDGATHLPARPTPPVRGGAVPAGAH